jgi:hypothetical protein
MLRNIVDICNVYSVCKIYVFLKHLLIYTDVVCSYCMLYGLCFFPSGIFFCFIGTLLNFLEDWSMIFSNDSPLIFF